ncbi:hypothetical protein [Variovorax sp. dw_954]|uniref:plasmid mobilization protein n=1 Tax=Variovorax sp. dw_954 TaxID=2720078 RepID=UPI001BD52E9E|nr:hypothetical protein [Variovorax sp. dw_954]
MSFTSTDGDIPMFARATLGGKRTAKCEARITDDTKFALERRAHELGMTVSDFIERLLTVTLFGLDHVLSIEQERTRKVMGLSADVQQGSQS